MKNIAIILAGGSGKRMGAPMPKQFLEVAGKTIVEHTVDAFERNPHIHEIAIVANADYLPEFEAVVARNPWKKVRRILLGGKERYDSTLSAIRAYAGCADNKAAGELCAHKENVDYGAKEMCTYKENTDYVAGELHDASAEKTNLILHDAVRPMVSQELIGIVALALEEHEAVGVAIPSTDTIWQTRNGFIESIPDRNCLMRAQTPQAFRLNLIKRAYALALADPAFRATDDCGVLIKYLPSAPSFIVEGEERNIKVTFKEDLPLLERFLKEKE